MSVQFGLLGDVVADVEGRPVDLGHAQQRRVLVALLVEGDRTVSVDQLIDRVWAENPPRRVRDTLYGYMYRLRHALACSAEVSIVRRPGGYRLVVDPAAVDVHRFRHLVSQARAEPDEQQSLRALDEALRLWRGDAFADLTTAETPWFDGQRQALHAQRLEAELDHADRALRLGRHRELLPDLTTRAAAHPLDERVAGQAMLALFRCGRQAEALERYQELRRRLADELGADPGPEVRRLHQRILTADPALAPAIGPPAVEEAPAVVPRQLPAAVADLAGRVHELALLTEHVSAAAEARSMAIVAINGAAGIGKTALAVHWAHQAHGRFPDGQLYVNLQGFHHSGRAMDPGEALRGFLDALGVPPKRVPPSPQAQAALFRSLLNGKRVLVVLDNARDPCQVRPLLPGTPGAVVVVTSRNRLSGLVAVDGAQPIGLDSLTRDEARQMLQSRIGFKPVADEPDAADHLVAMCGRLPLALSIVAARAVQTGFPLATLAAEMGEAGRRLDALSTDDPASEVRTAFSWSYRALTPGSARLFRLLGLHPGPDVSAAAAASLAALPAPEARRLLTQLTQASLVAEHRPGRYAVHDLLRVYAIELAHGTESGPDRHAAVHRMLDHYLHTAHAAARQLENDEFTAALAPARPGVRPEEPAGHEQALAWFTAEHAVLLAIEARDGGPEFDAHTWQLARSVATFLDRRGHWHDLATIGDAALAAGRRLADPAGEPLAHSILARAHLRLGDADRAHAHLRRALDLYDRNRDRAGLAHAHMQLARLLARRSPPDITQGMHHVQQAEALHRAAGHRAGRAQALNAIGWAHARAGDYRRALRCCREALPLLEEYADNEGQVHAWHSIGFAQHHLGRHTEAFASYQRALDLCRDLGDRYLETQVLICIGDTRRATGDHRAARDAWECALTILTELDHADADAVRAKLTKSLLEPDAWKSCTSGY